MKLNLASGESKIEGFLNVDISPDVKPDYVVDLEIYPWPFESGSIVEVICSHYVEHTADLILFMNELYRILKPGGTAKIVAPYYTSVRCWQDPTHKRAISENTFIYFNRGWRRDNKLEHYPIKTDFDFGYSYTMDAIWTMKDEQQRAFAVKHYWNVVSDINVILTKRLPDAE